MDLSGLNPFSFSARNPSPLPGAAWGSTGGDRLTTSREQLTSETQYQRNIYKPQFLPLFGPQVPSINVGYTTDSIPGAIYDSGVPGNQAFVSQFAGNAARYYNDFMTQPYTYSAARDEDTTPLGLKLKQWWAGLNITNPFNSVSTSADSARPEDKGADVVKLGAITLGGAALAAVAVTVLAKK